MVRYAERRGLSRRALCEAAQLHEQALMDPEARIDADADTMLWRHVAEQLGDGDLGLRFSADGIQDTSFGVFGLLLRSSETVGAALRTAASFYRLVKDDADMSLLVHGHEARVRWTPSRQQGRWVEPIEDAIVANCVLLARRWTDEAIGPRCIRLQRTRPARTDTYEELLGAPLEFGASATEIVFPAEVLQLALRPHDPAVARYLAVAAGTYLAQLQTPRSLEDEVLACLAAAQDRLGPSLPDVGQVARSLGLSSRTLQRRLREAGTSFQMLVDAHRRSTALALLGDPQLTVLQVANAAGFADRSSFRRAFRRWAQEAPTAVRAELRRRAESGDGGNDGAPSGSSSGPSRQTRAGAQAARSTRAPSTTA